MGKPLAKHTIKMMEYLRKHPGTSARDAALKFNIHVSRIHQLRRRIKDEELTVKTNKSLSGLTWTVSSTGAEGDLAEKTELAHAAMVESMRKGSPKESTNVDAILDARAENYGKFIDGAEIMQMLKRMVQGYIENRGTQLAFDQRESIDMIIHKLGRIINGNPDHVDSWRDIAGYATLVADRLEGNAR